MNRHDIWLIFCEESRQTVDATGIPTPIIHGEHFFRELIRSGAVTGRGVSVSLADLGDTQWQALERFVELFFNEFESYEPLLLFPAFRQEAERRGTPWLRSGNPSPMDHETWLIEEGDRIIRKQSRDGTDDLVTWERLVYALWVADYGMRNAGDLDAARDVDADFQSVAFQATEVLSLPITRGLFGLPAEAFEQRYFEMFDAVCNEIRSAEPGGETDPAGR